MERNLTCIICPLGCPLIVSGEGDNLTVLGSSCKRGEEYAKNEVLHPVRTVTSTVRCADGSMVSVKTKEPIPKDAIFSCMKSINRTIAPLPIRVGDVILKVEGGVPVVATQNKEEQA